MKTQSPCEIRIGGPLTAQQVTTIIEQHKGYPHPWEVHYDILRAQDFINSQLESVSYLYVCNARAEFGTLPETEDWLASEGISFDRYTGDGEEESTVYLRQYRPPSGKSSGEDRVLSISDNQPVVLLSRYLSEKSCNPSAEVLMAALDKAFGLDIPPLVPVSLKKN